MAGLMLTCKDVAALLVAREDRKLRLSERSRLQLHLLACQTCPDFERQMLTLRRAMRQWRNYGNDDGPDDSARPRPPSL
jgi:hypothetical protein